MDLLNGKAKRNSWTERLNGKAERKDWTVRLNGKREAKLEDAKKMKEKGIDIETISSITELTKEEIEKL